MTSCDFLDSTDHPLTAIPSRLIPSTCVIVYVPSLSQGEPSAALAWYVLVHRRADNGHWGFLGGAQEIGESILECAAREVEEEAGLAIEVDRLCAIDSDPGTGAICQYPDGGVVQYCCVVFSARPKVTPPMVLDPLPVVTPSAESLEVRWVPASQLPEPFLPHHRWRLARAMEINKVPAVR